MPRSNLPKLSSASLLGAISSSLSNAANLHSLAGTIPLLHCHALLPSPCISSAIVSGASCLCCRLFVDVCCKSTLQPLSCAAVIFVAVSLLTPSIFRQCHPLFHCHLFVEQCRQPSLIGMYNNCWQLLHRHALLPSPCISSVIVSDASCLCCRLFVDICCESTLQPLSCTAVIFVAVSLLTPSIFRQCHPLFHCHLFACRQPSLIGMYNNCWQLLHRHALLPSPCISSAIVSDASCLCCRLFCCESTLQPLSCTAVIFVAVSLLTPSIFHQCHPLFHCHLFVEQCRQPSLIGMYNNCWQLLHRHALLPSPCISSAIVSGASCLCRRLFVDACCESTRQPLSCAAVVAIVFVAVSLLTPSIFRQCHPLLHCHLFVEQCRQPSLIGMYNNC